MIRFLIILVSILAINVMSIQATPLAECSETALSTAIDDANTNGTGTITIPAGCTISLMATLPVITSDIVINNLSLEAGGVDAFRVYESGHLTLNNAHISGAGAVAWSDGLVDVNNSIFVNNVVGLWMNGGTAQATITNSTITGTSGSAVLLTYGGDVRLIASTLTHNVKAIGIDDLLRYDSRLEIEQSIVALNQWGISGGIRTVTSYGYNVIGSDTTSIQDEWQSTDIVGVDPLLTAYVDGFFPLAAGSPAVDLIPAALCAVSADQRGMARPVGTGCDAGAIEMAQTEAGVVEVIEPIAPPPVNTWNTTTEDTPAHAEGFTPEVYGTIHMENGAWRHTPGGVPVELIDYGVLVAVDVWEMGGDQYFDNYQQICLRGEGRMIFLDATLSPRPQVEITPVTYENGYTCGWIPNAGTVVLIPS